MVLIELCGYRLYQNPPAYHSSHGINYWHPCTTHMRCRFRFPEGCAVLVLEQQFKLNDKMCCVKPQERQIEASSDPSPRVPYRQDNIRWGLGKDHGLILTASLRLGDPHHVYKKIVMFKRDQHWLGNKQLSTTFKSLFWPIDPPRPPSSADFVAL